MDFSFSIKKRVKKNNSSLLKNTLITRIINVPLLTRFLNFLINFYYLFFFFAFSISFPILLYFALSYFGCVLYYLRFLRTLEIIYSKYSLPESATQLTGEVLCPVRKPPVKGTDPLLPRKCTEFSDCTSLMLAVWSN